MFRVRWASYETVDLAEHIAYLQHFVDLGFGEIYVHNVGRNQEAIIRAYGKSVIPNLNWSSNTELIGEVVMGVSPCQFVSLCVDVYGDLMR